jgi:hypothetical protein
MSKPNIRIVLSVVLCLVVLAGVFSVAQGAALNAGGRSGQPHVDAGLLPDTSRARSGFQETQSFAPYYEGQGKGGCERDSHLDPDD